MPNKPRNEYADSVLLGIESGRLLLMPKFKSMRHFEPDVHLVQEFLCHVKKLPKLLVVCPVAPSAIITYNAERYAMSLIGQDEAVLFGKTAGRFLGRQRRLKDFPPDIESLVSFSISKPLAPYASPLAGFQESLRIDRGHATCAGGCDCLPVFGILHVSGREDARQACGGSVRGDDIALFVHVELSEKQGRIWSMPDGDEHTGARDFGCFPRHGILQPDTGDELGTEYVFHNGVPEEGDLLVLHRPVLHNL